MSPLIDNIYKDAFREHLLKCGENADHIKIAVAYFSDMELIKKWVEKGKYIDLYVALQIPTTPAALRLVLQLDTTKVNLYYVTKSFHSKCYLFNKGENVNAGFIGSSNFTKGGLSSNIEANMLIDRDNEDMLVELQNHFERLKKFSNVLTPIELDKYETIYDRKKDIFRKSKSDQEEFNQPRSGKKRIRPDNICKEARDYLKFWEKVDIVAKLVKDLSKEEWPNIPVYLTVDHFWHWIKEKWDKKNIKKIQGDLEYREKEIPRLFKKYIHYDKADSNFTKTMPRVSKELNFLLGRKRINKLSKEEAEKVYRSLHSGRSRAARFSADKKFAKENNIKKIQKSLEYLLFSEDQITEKIHRLINDPKYKLKEFGPSNIQELIGWMSSGDMPLRNRKADYAVEILGYKFK